MKFLALAAILALPSAGPAAPKVAPDGDPLPEGAIARPASSRHRTPFLGGQISPEAVDNRVAAFTADGQQVALAVRPDLVRFLNTRTGRSLRDVWLGPAYGLKPQKAQLSPDARRAFAWGSLREGLWFRVWDLETGTVAHTVVHHAKFHGTHEFTLSADGRRVDNTPAARYGEKQMQSWDVTTGKYELVPAVPPPPMPKHSADGKYRLSHREREGTEAVWTVTEVATGRDLWRAEEQPTFLSPAVGITVSPDGSHVAVSQSSLTVRRACVFDVNTGRMASRYSTGFPFLSVGYSPDGKWFGHAHDESFALPDGGVVVETVELATGRVVTGSKATEMAAGWVQPGDSFRGDVLFGRFVRGEGRKPFPPPSRFQTSLPPVRPLQQTTSADRRLYAAVTEPGYNEPRNFKVTEHPEYTTVWERSSFQQVARRTDLRDRVRAMVTRPDGRQWPEVGRAWTHFVRLGPDGRQAFLFGPDGCRVWDVLTDDVRPFVADEAAQKWLASASSADVSPDGTRLVTGHSEGTVLVWDVRRPADVPLTAGERQAAWDDLARPGGAKAVWRLAADPASVPFLAERVRPAAEPSPDPEAPADGEELRSLRATGVFESARTPAAREALGRLAAGHAQNRLTTQAAAALRRVNAFTR